MIPGTVALSVTYPLQGYAVPFTSFSRFAPFPFFRSLPLNRETTTRFSGQTVTFIIHVDVSASWAL
ncbi:hypothetical protein SCLCIDRAFT_863536 [Scleroderma citrinum Foug A]|uniref:Uncharacterized protein n=1 Tax=Scleroderma citrinum Foug A TaxID=1036808 RepID=A0A0C3DM10_9AGAM|nr:hypothetical protein SCLCIDRAFT_863536 [Scleroderma citrinum Foug A]